MCGEDRQHCYNELVLNVLSVWQKEFVKVPWTNIETRHDTLSSSNIAIKYEKCCKRKQQEGVAALSFGDYNALQGVIHCSSEVQLAYNCDNTYSVVNITQ